MKKIAFLILFLYSLAAFGQITVNTNFAVNGNLPIDARDTLTTLADTAGVTWTYPGLLSYAKDVDQFWYFTGSFWKELADLSTLPAATSITASEKIVMSDSTVTWAKLSNQIQDTIYKRPTKRWALIGDSFSASLTSSSRFPKYVIQDLGLTGTVTYAVSGHSSGAQNTALGNLLASDSTAFDTIDFVTVLVGINDYSASATLGTIADTAGTASVAGQIKQIVERLAGANTDLDIFLITPPECFGNVTTGGYKIANAGGWTVAQLASLISEIGNYYGCKIINFWAQSGWNEETKNYYTSDLLHPSAIGAEKMGFYVANAIRQGIGNPVVLSGTTTPTLSEVLTAGNTSTSSATVGGLTVSAATPVLTINATANNANGIELKSGAAKEAEIKINPTNGNLNISAGRYAGWGGDISFTTDLSVRGRVLETGQWIFNNYATPGTFSGTTSSFPTFASSGALIQRTASEIRTDLGLNSLATQYFAQNGNSFNAAAVLGTNDAYNLQFETNNAIRVTIDTTGRLGLGTTAPNVPFEIYNSQPYIRLRQTTNVNPHGIQWYASGAYDADISQYPTTGEFRFSVGRNASWGGNVTFYTDTNRRMKIFNTGKITFDTYTASTSFPGTTSHFLTMSASGELLTKSAATFRSEIGAGTGIEYVIQSTAPATTKRWVDRTTWDSTTVFQVKDYILGQGWKTVGYLDTINYAFSSQPPIYIVVTGQSNSTPRVSSGYSNPADTTASPLTTIWDGAANAWQALHTGEAWMNGTTPNRSVWWPMTFGKQAAEKEGRIVKIVYAGLGGREISYWKIGGLQTQWDTISQRIAASKIPRMDAVFWYQGETDGWTNRTPTQYRADWFTVMNQFRALSQWHESTKVVAVQINTGRAVGETPTYPFVKGEMANQVFNRFADDEHEWTYVLKNDDTVIQSDSSHIDGDSHVKLGKRLWDLYSGKISYNPFEKHDRNLITGDSAFVDFASPVVTLATTSGSSTYVRGHKNWVDGWVGTVRVLNNNVNIIPPDGLCFCNNDLGELLEVDTFFAPYISPAYLRNDTLILTQCPNALAFDDAEPLPIELGVFWWADANQEVAYADGASVTTLTDWSGNARNFTGSANPPNYRVGALNGKPSFRFRSGNSEFFTYSGTDFSFLHNDSSSVFIVFKPGGDDITNPDSLYAIISSQDAAGSSFTGYSYYYDDRSAFSVSDRATGIIGNASLGLVASSPATTAATANSFHLGYNRNDPANATPANRMSMQIDNGAGNSGNTASNAPNAGTRPSLHIGKFNGATANYFSGEIAEILIFNKHLTSADVTRLRTYFNQKYQLNLN